MKKFLLGIRPTSKKGIHLGHYLGVIKPAIDIQDNLDILIADLYDSENYSDILISQIKRLLPKANIILQSDFQSELSKLYFNLSNIITVGKLSHMTQYKSKKDPTLNFLTYPVLMCADLMFFGDSKKIIVGSDQIQHIEYANDFIKKYNTHYKTKFKKVDVMEFEGVRIMDLKNPEIKMSKSNNDCGTLYLSDTDIEKKITKATSNDIGCENLLRMYKNLGGQNDVYEKTSDLKNDIICLLKKM